MHTNCLLPPAHTAGPALLPCKTPRFIAAHTSHTNTPPSPACPCPLSLDKAPLLESGRYSQGHGLTSDSCCNLRLFFKIPNFVNVCVFAKGKGGRLRDRYKRVLPPLVHSPDDGNSREPGLPPARQDSSTQGSHCLHRCREPDQKRSKQNSNRCHMGGQCCRPWLNLLCHNI